MSQSGEDKEVVEDQPEKKLSDLENQQKSDDKVVSTDKKEDDKDIKKEDVIDVKQDEPSLADKIKQQSQKIGDGAKKVANDVQLQTAAKVAIVANEADKVINDKKDEGDTQAAEAVLGFAVGGFLLCFLITIMIFSGVLSIVTLVYLFIDYSEGNSCDSSKIWWYLLFTLIMQAIAVYMFLRKQNVSDEKELFGTGGKIVTVILVIILPLCGIMNLMGAAGSGCDDLRESGIYIVAILNVLQQVIMLLFSLYFYCKLKDEKNPAEQTGENQAENSGVNDETKLNAKNEKPAEANDKRPIKNDTKTPQANGNTQNDTQQKVQ